MSADEADREPPHWRRYLRFWRPNIDADVREEVAFHMEALVAEQTAAGVPEPEARRIAEQRFGNAEDIGRTMRALANQRETTMRRAAYLDQLVRDLRFAKRQLAKRPAFTAMAVVTLALGIGANTAIFSAVNTVLLHPVGVPDPGGLAFVHINLPTLPLMNAQLDPAVALDLADNPGVFQAIGAYSGGSQILAGNEARRIAGVRTVGRFFDVFGVAPAAGRFYRPEESTPGRHQVVVLSYQLWQELGGKPSIVGTKLEFATGSYEVVGVAPASFRFPRTAEVWSPYPIAPAAACGKQDRTPDGFSCRIDHGVLIMSTIGRLRPGVTDAAVRMQLNQLAAQRHLSTAPSQLFYSYQSFVKETAGELRPALLALLGAVGFVLLIACANVASLQLVHGAARTREIAVRSALGAERGTIIRQLVAENLVLSIAGGFAGLALGAAILKLLTVSAGTAMPQLASVHLDRTVLAFTAIATIVSGLAFGLIPALRSSRVDLQTALREGGRGQAFGASKGGLLHAGVILQVALTLMLLLGSALMIKTMTRLLEHDPGFRAEGVATMRMTLSGQRYRGRGAFLPVYDGVLDRLSHVQGITYAGYVSDLPFTGGTDSSPFTIQGMPTDPNGPARHSNIVAVGGDYFKAMGIPLLKGRAFNKDDVNGGAPVAVIDETLAKQFFGDKDPIGQHIDQSGPTATIVGVVGTVAQIDLSDKAKATTYYPMMQHDWYSSPFIVVRSGLTLGVVTGIVRGTVSSIDPNAPVFATQMLVDRVNDSLATRRLTMAVMSGLAAVSLLLAVCGLYGVISYIVSRRSTEFGIRLALGAQAGQVRLMVVRQGLALAIGGIAVGLIGAAAGTRALGSLLYGVSAHDASSFTLAAIGLGLIAVGASYLPARRATRVNPVEALRRGE